MNKANTDKKAKADPDIQLMSRLKEGDEDAMRPLMDAHMPWVYNLASRMCASKEEAQDITQEVFLKIWRVRETWNPQAKLSKWIYQVAVNTCLDKLKKPSLVALGGEGSDEKVMRVGVRKIVDDLNVEKVLTRTIKELPVRQKAAFVLCQYEGQSMPEAAEIMDVPPSTIETLFVQSMQAMRRALMPLAKDANEMKGPMS